MITTCSHCGTEVDVSVTLPLPGTWHNPPESGEVLPEDCPLCGEPLDTDTILAERQGRIALDLNRALRLIAH